MVQAVKGLFELKLALKPKFGPWAPGLVFPHLSHVTPSYTFIKVNTKQQEDK